MPRTPAPDALLVHRALAPVLARARAPALALAVAFVPACGGGARCPEPGSICAAAGTGELGDGPDGSPALDTGLARVTDVTFAPGGVAYVVDFDNHRVRAWDLAADVIVTAVGTGLQGAGPPGPLSEARLHHPTGAAIAPDGALVIAVWHAHVIGRADLATGTFEILCGTGLEAFGGEGVPCADADFAYPSAVAYDAAGNLYVADQGNNRVRVVDTAGIVTTFAGTGLGAGVDPMTGQPLPACAGASPTGTEDCWTGDGGPAVSATLNNPRGQAALPAGRVAVAPDGTAFIADTANHVVRRVDAATGTITTVAGTGGVEGRGGDGGPATAATLDEPTDVALAPDGTLYIADTGNHCVRAVLPDGTLTTAAGTCGDSGYDGDGGAALDALLDTPLGVALSPDGALYVADTGNNLLRVVYR